MAKTRKSMPSRSSIRAHWAPRLVALGRADSIEDVLDCDWCFSCGFESPMKTERAHILACCEGGTHELTNLHLLCPPCHIASEGFSGSAYWRWFDERTPLDALAQVLEGRVYPESHRRLTSSRVRAGLNAARERGVRLGRAPGVVESPEETVALIKELRAGRLSYRAIAAELDRRGLEAPRGRGWNQETVRKAHLSDD